MNQQRVDTINNVTADEIKNALNLYCAVCPHLKNDLVKECLELSQQNPLTFDNKIKIFGKMQELKQPKVILIGERAFIEVEGYEYEAKQPVY